MKKREKVSMATVRKERDAWLEVDKAFLLDVFREKRTRTETRYGHSSPHAT